MKIDFVPVREDHLDIVREIYNYYVLNTTATYHLHEISREEVYEIIPVNHSKYKSFLIYDDSEPVGYCYLGQYKKSEAYDRTAEVTIYLKHGHQGKGIGLQTLNFLEKCALDRNILVLIGIISGDNEGSIRLFEKAGYEKCAHFRRVGEKFGKILDVVAYQKIIDNRISAGTKS